MSKLNRFALSALVIGASAFGLSDRAYAGNTSSSMTVAATVANTCTINAGPLSFPAYDPTLGTVLNGTAALTVTCTNGAAATIDLGQGSNADSGSTATAPKRRLKYTDTANTDHFVSYDLYQDASHTQAWAATTGYNASYTGTGSSQTVTVYGQVAANQTSAPAGTYNDTISAQINF